MSCSVTTSLTSVNFTDIIHPKIDIIKNGQLKSGLTLSSNRLSPGSWPSCSLTGVQNDTHYDITLTAGLMYGTYYGSMNFAITPTEKCYVGDALTIDYETTYFTAPSNAQANGHAGMGFTTQQCVYAGDTRDTTSNILWLHGGPSGAISAGVQVGPVARNTVTIKIEDVGDYFLSGVIYMQATANQTFTIKIYNMSIQH